MKKSMFVLLLVCGLLLSVPAQGAVTITPSNVQVDAFTVSFDLAIMDPDGVSGRAFQGTIGSISGPGTLTFDQTSSMAIDGEAGYWLLGNSGGIGADDNLDGSYMFGDDSFDSSAVPLAADDLMARFVFGYDTPGDYIVTLDLDVSASLIMDEFFSTNAFLFSPGLFPGDSDSFTLTLVPEPATLMLFGLGGFMLRKRRK